MGIQSCWGSIEMSLHNCAKTTGQNKKSRQKINVAHLKLNSYNEKT